MIKNKKGFTLIELLVVISIIGILAALSLVAFTTSQRQAKDTKRKSDLKQYSTSLEAFANSTGGLYPADASTTVLYVGNNPLCTSLSMTNCPGDPNNPVSGLTPDPAHQYKYITDGTTGSNNATKYVLWGNLEGTSGYWVLCSSGKSGLFTPVSSWTDPTGGACPI